MALIKTPDDGAAEKKTKKLKKQLLNSDTVKYTINIPTKIHIAFKRKSFGERKSMRDIFLRMILNYIENEEP